MAESGRNTLETLLLSRVVETCDFTVESPQRLRIGAAIGQSLDRPGLTQDEKSILNGRPVVSDPGVAEACRWDRVLSRRLHRAFDAGSLESKRLGVIGERKSPCRFVVLTNDSIDNRSSCLNVLTREVERTLAPLSLEKRREARVVLLTDATAYAKLRSHSSVSAAEIRFRLQFENPTQGRPKEKIEPELSLLEVFETGVELASIREHLSRHQNGRIPPGAGGEAGAKKPEAQALPTLWERHESGSLSGAILGGRLRVLREISHDLYGAVYEAWEEVRGARCAIRVVNPARYSDKALETLSRTQHILDDLSHPAISPWEVQGKAGGEENGVWFREDWGGTRLLRSQIEEIGAEPLENCLPMIWWLTDAIASAESRGPEAAHGHLELDDLVLVGGDGPGFRVRRWGQTPRSDHDSIEGDLSALGRISFAILTGLTHEGAEKDRKTRWRRSRTPRPMRQWVDRLIDEQAERRFRSAAQALDALRRLRGRRKKTPWLKAAVLMIALGGLGFWGYQSLDWAEFLRYDATAKDVHLRLEPSQKTFILHPDSLEYSFEVTPSVAVPLHAKFVGKDGSSTPIDDWTVRFDAGRIVGVAKHRPKWMRTLAAIEAVDDSGNVYRTPPLEWVYVPNNAVDFEIVRWDRDGTLTLRSMGPKVLIQSIVAKGEQEAYPLKAMGDAGLWRGKVDIESRDAELVLTDIAGQTIKKPLSVPEAMAKTPELRLRVNGLPAPDTIEFHSLDPPEVLAEVSEPGVWSWTLRPSTGQERRGQAESKTSFQLPREALRGLPEESGDAVIEVHWPDHPSWEAQSRRLIWAVNNKLPLIDVTLSLPSDEEGRRILFGQQFPVATESFSIHYDPLAEMDVEFEVFGDNAAQLVPELTKEETRTTARFANAPEGNYRLVFRSKSGASALRDREVFEFSLVVDRTPPKLRLESDEEPRVIRMDGSPGPWLAMRVDEEVRGEITVFVSIRKRGGVLENEGAELYQTSRVQTNSGFSSWPLAELLQEPLGANPDWEDGDYEALYWAVDAQGNKSDPEFIPWILARSGPSVSIRIPDQSSSPVRWYPHEDTGKYYLVIDADDPNGVRSLAVSFSIGDELDAQANAVPDEEGRWVVAYAFNEEWHDRKIEVTVEALDDRGARGVEKLPAWIVMAPPWEAPKKLLVSKEGVDITDMVGIDPDPAYVVAGRDVEIGGDLEYGVGSYRMEKRREGLVSAARFRPFYLDEYEVTRRQFLQFVEAGDGYLGDANWPPSAPFRDENRRRDLVTRLQGRGDEPVAGIEWAEAVAYAAWVGKRLPTHLEWEYALRGGIEYRRHSADRGPDANFAINGKGPWQRWKGGDSSLFGVWNLSGNVSEWTTTEAPDNAGLDGAWYWVVGGSFRTSRGDFAVVRPFEAHSRRDDVGFRCALDADRAKGGTLGPEIQILKGK